MTLPCQEFQNEPWLGCKLQTTKTSELSSVICHSVLNYQVDADATPTLSVMSKSPVFHPSWLDNLLVTLGVSNNWSPYGLQHQLH